VGSENPAEANGRIRRPVAAAAGNVADAVSRDSDVVPKARAERPIRPRPLKKYGFVPDKLVTDGPRRYAAAARDVGIAGRFERGAWRNNGGFASGDATPGAQDPREAGRPKWLFGKSVHEGCDRAGDYEQGDFTHEYGSPKCLVKIGCCPVVQCNVRKRGWMAGIGGCPNVGGICIGCTMPGFPDKFMPFMDQPPGATLSSNLIKPYGALTNWGRSMFVTHQASSSTAIWGRPI
jgi:hypothetical protein